MHGEDYNALGLAVSSVLRFLLTALSPRHFHLPVLYCVLGPHLPIFSLSYQLD